MQLNLIQLSKKNKLNINIIFFSILLLPISLFAGPAITEILIFFTYVAFIYTFINEKNFLVIKNFEIIIISFFFLIIISSLLSDYKIISLKSSLLSIRFIILIYAIIFIINKIDGFFKFFFIICFGSLLLNILVGYLQFFYDAFYQGDLFLNKNVWVTESDPKLKVSGLFGNEKKLGSFLCRLFPITVGLYFLVSKVNNNKKIINILIFFIPLFILVFLTSERMSLIYCTLTFFFICFYATKINKKNIIVFPLLIILVTLILYFSDFNRFKQTIDNSYKQLFPKGKFVYFSLQHEFFALTSFELFKDNPILGIGPNNYRRKCHEYSPAFIAEEYNYEKGTLYKAQNKKIPNCSTHPHNIFFQLLSEIGLLGIIYYVVFNIFLFIQIIKFFFKKDYNQISFFFLLPVIYYLNPLFPSGNFFNNWYMCFGILGLPFYLYLTRINKSD